MSEENRNSQLAEVQAAIQKVNQASYEKFPVNSAYPVGCDERADFINRGLDDVKKRFPESFK